MPLLCAVKRGEVKSTREAYAKGLQPEKALIKDLVTPQALATHFEAEMVGALCGTSHLKGVQLVCAKLLEKCMSISGNHTESVRYIRAQFTKAYASTKRGVAFLLAGCILLGMIPGTSLAPPKLRIEFHENPDEQISKLVEKLPSRSLWFALISVVSHVCKMHPIFRKTRMKGGFAPLFDTDKISLQKIEVVKNTLIPALQGDETKTLSPPEIKRKAVTKKRQSESISAESFVGVKHKRRLTENTVRGLFSDALSVDESKKKLAKIYRKILHTAPRSQRIDRNLLKLLNIDNAHGTTVYEHAVEQRRTLSLIPKLCHGNGKASEKSPQNAIFCTDCFTMRTRARGSCQNKATESTILMKDGSHQCAACRNPKCIAVDISNYNVTTMMRHIDAVPIVASECGVCKYTSCITNIVGTTVVCSSCYKDYVASYQAQSSVNRRCLICEKMLSKRSHYMPVVFQEEQSELGVAHVCNTCSFLENPSRIWIPTKIKKLLGQDYR